MAIADDDVAAIRLTLTGNNAANTLTGGDESDTLLGLGGKDVLFRGLGDDAIAGGLGADSTTGGAGADRFIYAGATKAATLKSSLIGAIDRVADFSFSQGVKFQLDFDNNLITPNRPKGLFNSGRERGRTLAAAAQSAYADKNQRQRGNTSLSSR